LEGLARPPCRVQIPAGAPAHSPRSLAFGFLGHPLEYLPIGSFCPTQNFLIQKGNATRPSAGGFHQSSAHISGRKSASPPVPKSHDSALMERESSDSAALRGPKKQAPEPGSVTGRSVFYEHAPQVNNVLIDSEMQTLTLLTQRFRQSPLSVGLNHVEASLGKNLVKRYAKLTERERRSFYPSSDKFMK
jgi:hypothetical protein